MKNCSIVVIHFGSVDQTITCVDSIASSKSRYPYELVIVDNSGTDNSGHFKKAAKRVKALKYIKNQSTNKGFSAGIKLGEQNATYDYLVILDNDTTVEAGWLDSLMRPFEISNRVGITTSVITDPGAERFKIVGGKVNILGFSYPNKVLSEQDNAHQDDKLFFGVTSWCIKKALLKKIKVDTSFKFFADDADIGFKVKSLGYDVVAAVGSKVNHFKLKKDSYNKTADGYKTVVRNRDYLIFTFKNLPLWHFTLFFLSFLLIKIMVMPYRLLFSRYKNIGSDMMGTIQFFQELKKVLKRKTVTDKLRSVNYLKLMEDYSPRLIVTNLIFK